MDHPEGAGLQRADRVDFDPRVRLEFRGTQLSSDGGLLVMRELDDALGLSDLASAALRDTRSGKNTVHRLDGLFRQSFRLGATRQNSVMFVKLTWATDCVEWGYPQKKTGFMDKTTIYETVGGNIRRERIERDMNQAELARRVGLSRTSVTNLELGRQSLLVHQLVNIANALGVEPASLIAIDSDEAPEAAPMLSPALSQWVESLKSRNAQG